MSLYNIVYDKTPQELEELIKKHPYPNAIGREVLTYSKTPSSILMEHAHIGEMYNNTSIPIEVYERGMSFNDERLDGSIARSSNTPALILSKIYDRHTKNHSILVDLARNSRAPYALLEKVARDKNWDVLSHVIHNKNSDVKLFKALLGHEDPRVSISIKEELKKRFNIEINWGEVKDFISSPENFKALEEAEKKQKSSNLCSIHDITVNENMDLEKEKASLNQRVNQDSQAQDYN